jgi:hypothetical protein
VEYLKSLSDELHRVASSRRRPRWGITASSVSCAPRLIHITGSSRSWPGIRSDVAVSSRFPPCEPRVPVGFSSFDLEVEVRREDQEEQAYADEPTEWQVHIYLHRALNLVRDDLSFATATPSAPLAILIGLRLMAHHLTHTTIASDEMPGAKNLNQRGGAQGVFMERPFSIMVA